MLEKLSLSRGLQKCAN